MKVSSNSEMVRAGVLFENFGDYRELMLSSFFSTFCIMVSMGINTNEQWVKIIRLIQDFFKAHFYKGLSKYLHLLGNKCRFSFFHIMSPRKIQVTIATT